MKSFLTQSTIRKTGNEGFTMVEIALCIAIVAFAMVALLGVLPTGMTVEKDNQEDTLINQEGQYWIEAFRSGSRGLNDLTNYVEILMVDTDFLNQTNMPIPVSLTKGVIPSELIIGLLSQPQYTYSAASLTNANITNVTAIVKAITGPAAEKGALTNEFSFRYQLSVAFIAQEKDFMLPSDRPPRSDEIIFADTMNRNLHDLKVTLRWPVFEKGTGYEVGKRRKVFRARVGGQLALEPNRVQLPGVAALPMHFIKPNVYAYVTQ